MPRTAEKTKKQVEQLLIFSDAHRNAFLAHISRKKLIRLLKTTHQLVGKEKAGLKEGVVAEREAKRQSTEHTWTLLLLMSEMGEQLSKFRLNGLSVRDLIQMYECVSNIFWAGIESMELGISRLSGQEPTRAIRFGTQPRKVSRPRIPRRRKINLNALPKYAQSANKDRIVRIICKKRCKRSALAEMTTDFPGREKLRFAPYNAYTARCLRCGGIAGDCYNFAGH